MSLRRDNRAQKLYATLPKNKAKLMLCYEMGELNFRRSRRTESIKKYGNVNCLVPHCNFEDKLSHVQTCEGYTSRLPDGAGPYEFIQYLSDLELERNKSFNRSLINFKTFQFTTHHQCLLAKHVKYQPVRPRSPGVQGLTRNRGWEVMR